MIPAARKFSDDGGVLVSLDAAVPFLIALEQGAEGFWKLSPDKPAFAWQTDEMLKHIGLQYLFEPEKHSQGVRHAPTKILKSLADSLPDVNGRLDSRRVIPPDGAQYIPLIRSRRLDGIDVPGPLHVIKNANRTSIIGTTPIFTLGASPDFWKHSDATLSALAKRAMNIRSGKWTPAEYTRIVFVPTEMLAGKMLTLSNPGRATLTFDAVQLEHQRNPRTRCIGLGAGQEGHNNYPEAESRKWGGIRARPCLTSSYQATTPSGSCS